MEKKSLIIGVIAAIKEQEKAQKVFDRAIGAKNRKQKRRYKKESVMRMRSQCLGGQQFRCRKSGKH